MLPNPKALPLGYVMLRLWHMALVLFFRICIKSARCERLKALYIPAQR